MRRGATAAQVLAHALIHALVPVLASRRVLLVTSDGWDLYGYVEIGVRLEFFAEQM